MAAITRTLSLIGWTPPRRSISRSCSTRSSLTCVAGDSSPISSRKIVPPWASSKRPFFSVRASVKAPGSWPNSSDSIRLSGSAAQLTLTNGFLARGDE